MQEIWNLIKNDNIPRDERLILGTTLDNVLVKKENIPILLYAFNKFEANTSLKDQAKTIQEAIKNNDDISVIAWNQTSVCDSPWNNYNYLKQKEHWFLFDEKK